eukprot:m.23445 g.23445  ORF g.23445 m.23445 type:complete len:274 (-) comp11383_c0_seq1:81-902(-)
MPTTRSGVSRSTEVKLDVSSIDTKLAAKAIVPKDGASITCSDCWFSKPEATAEAAKRAVTTSNMITPRQRAKLKDDDVCGVCLEQINDFDASDDDAVQLRQCTDHFYHRDCIAQWLTQSPRCPVCFNPYGPVIGSQPPGTMHVTLDMSSQLPGHLGHGVISFSYSFPSGTQDERMPKPGSRYSGTSRTAYLPASTEGLAVLARLQKAWDHRQLFRVGRSVTTGCDNTTVWNGIHHKTNHHGGPSGFGYPDETYLDRVKEELAAAGVTHDCFDL